MRVWVTTLYFLIAAGYIASLHFTPYTGSFAVKVAPLVLLFFALAMSAYFRGKILLLVAIFFSGVGDVVLDLGFEGSFIAGLAAFLIAHLWYIALFWLDVEKSRFKFAQTALAIAYPMAMAVFLWPHLGELKIPVAVYIVVIATMLVFAINRGTTRKTVLVGAIFFVVSDSILALNKFYYPHPAAHAAIMATYYLAQYLIASGILKEKNKH